MSFMIPLVLLLIQRVYSDSPIIETPWGQIRGVPADDGDYNMFLGIPYARVDPDNPFGAAKPVPKFTGIFEANNGTTICPQKEEDSHEIRGTLDCLVLHIYVPKKAKIKLPVLVFIHGGFHEFGEGGPETYGPNYLVRHGIIVVSINYRLGPYGFMCLDIPEVSGNQGLKDQTKALRWIRQNIELFGGDSDKITLYGQSSGAVSVEFHLLSENENLYNQAIVQSGGTYVWRAVESRNNTIPLLLASDLGFKTYDVYKALAYLKGIEVERVIESATRLKIQSSACIEKKFNGVEGFLYVDPVTIKTLPKTKNLPLLVGITNAERLLYVFRTLTENPLGYDPFKDLERYVPQNEMSRAYDIVRRFYIGDAPISMEVMEELIDFDSDFKYTYPSEQSVIRFLKSEAKLYHFLFSYSGGRNKLKVRENITIGGAAHSDDVGYIFETISLRGKGSDADFLVLDRMTTMWANFVKYGNPTPEITDLLPIAWPIATTQQLHYLNIDKELSLGIRPFHNRFAFWDLFYLHYVNNAGVLNSINYILLFVLGVYHCIV
ncbi:juvenile hormone esterase-like [Pieris brassicae]|uniref:juvenile hormone esterase-like n=1 Tax=Pieris brassicae TaxID=7116 RepID=UPI001E661AFF|nr:juvenile hormone esterase-like [Pieris brassicae]